MKGWANQLPPTALSKLEKMRQRGLIFFFANVSNRHWAMKHLGHDQNGFRDQYVIVDRLEDVQVKRAIHSQFGERDYSRFEDFVDAARPFLRWEFEHYQS